MRYRSRCRTRTVQRCHTEGDPPATPGPIAPTLTDGSHVHALPWPGCSVRSPCSAVPHASCLCSSRLARQPLPKGRGSWAPLLAVLQVILGEAAQPGNGLGDAAGPGPASVAAFGRRDERGRWSQGISTDFFQAAREPAESSAQCHADIPVEARQSSAAGDCGEERIFPRRPKEPHRAQPLAPPAWQGWETKSCSLKGRAVQQGRRAHTLAWCLFIFKCRLASAVAPLPCLALGLLQEQTAASASRKVC